jgi:dTDP-4-amino-4,6-dideoxygalactose transaminase
MSTIEDSGDPANLHVIRMSTDPTSAAAQEQSGLIPFNRPYLSGKELEYIQQAIELRHISGNGPFSSRCEVLLKEITGCRRALLTTSCTDALEMAALLLDIAPGDEVIVPSFTFVSTANAFALRGARIVFADIRPDTLNLDESLLSGLITERTRAIVPVHYAGVGCEMNRIMAVAKPHGITIVEDNAHGLFGTYHGRRLGTFGQLASLSFHETKNISCGEGGALLLNDDAYIERAEILREKGTNRSRFFRGEVDKYSWVDIGSSFLPSDLLAAFLAAQLESRDHIQSLRQHIWQTYFDRLSNWASAHGVRLPVVPADCQQSYHMFYLLLPSGAARDRLIQHLQQRRIKSVFHYLPLHSSEMGQRSGGYSGQCPVTEDVSARLVRLPFYNGLTEQDQSRIVESVLDFPE